MFVMGLAQRNGINSHEHVRLMLILMIVGTEERPLNVTAHCSLQSVHLKLMFAHKRNTSA